MASENQEPTGREILKKRWTPQEDEKQTEAAAVHGTRNWPSLASKAGLNRSGKSCRLRWVNQLRPDLKRGYMSCQEQDLIDRLHNLHGNRWSLIAGKLPGRTDNEIKNYINTRLGRNIPTVDKETSVVDDDQEVHVEIDSCLSSEVDTSVTVMNKEVIINPENYSDTEITNFDVAHFLNFDEETFELASYANSLN